MQRKTFRILLTVLAFVMGISLFRVTMTTIAAQSGSQSDLSAPRSTTVTVTPGNPVEIAATTFNGWGTSQDFYDAVQMAINDYGTIQGFSIQRNDYDAGCDSTSGQNAANLIVGNAQNVGVIGPFCSNSTASAASVFEASGVVMISNASTAGGIETNGPTTFNRVVVTDTYWAPWISKVDNLPSVLNWQKEFENQYGRSPDQFARFAYDATTLLLTRIDQVATLQSGNLVIDRAALATAVRNTSDFLGVTDYITLDTEGNRLDTLTRSGTRYVATSGSDPGNDCTDSKNPCATVQRGIALANPTETVLVAGGTYTENVTTGISVTVMGGYEAVSWTRSLTQYETIIDGSGSPLVPGDWDGERVSKPSVLKDGSTYKMWFDGKSQLTDAAVGLATSSDGISWTKEATNPVVSGTVGAWDEYGGERSAFVMKDGSTYKMWYEGENSSGARQLGYATSSDGLAWTKNPNPVLQAGPETYDQQVAGHGSVLKENSTYKLWYHALGDQGAVIAYATSSDGVNWTKQGIVLNPVGGSWDTALWGPSVLNLGGTYWMWYSGWGPLGPVIGVVTSTDGTSWNRPQSSPVLTDTNPIGDPHVISDTGKLKMWYNDFGSGTINYAESADGISWTKYVSNPVLMPGTATQFSGPVFRVVNDNLAVTLDGLTITGGEDIRVGGVFAEGNFALTIKNSIIRGNRAYGGGDGWAGGGILGGNPLTIINSQIINNQTGGGAGGVRPGGAVTVVNSLIADNKGDAGIHVNQSATLLNSTIANNDGGVLYNPQESATLLITNSIVYSNNWSLTDIDTSTMFVTFSDIEGGWTGTGNIDQNPRFVDPSNGDYHLAPGSPVIDQGTATGAPTDDLEGNTRDAVPDMGAYEWVGYRLFLPILMR